MDRRIYIIDFGDFVKIGISQNIEKRLAQLPYDAKRFYCTEKIENAQKLEKILHSALKEYKCNTEAGREYFKIDYEKIVAIFSEAQDEIMKMINDPKKSDDQIANIIKLLYTMQQLPAQKRTLLFGISLGMLANDRR